MSFKYFCLTFAVLNLFFYANAFNSDKNNIPADVKFLNGNDNLIRNNSAFLKNKNIAVITNNSGVLSDGTLLLDALHKEFNVLKVFIPEHGLRGDDRDENYTDETTGLPVISLYGSNKKPSANQLSDVDVFVYDIQDVGARFYSFINTMFYCMESAAENDKEFIVCDRPLIPYGKYTDGFMLDPGISSFAGMINVPVAYGMTCGELALYINEEYFGNKCKLQISKMENYTHGTDYSSLNLPWIKPSPSIYFPSSAVAYLGTCFFEGTNYSEGRGSDKPFEYTGAPYCNGEALADELNSYNLKGVKFDNITFTPTTITSPSNPPKYVGEVCEGVYLNVTDVKTFEPVKAAIAMLVSLNKLFPQFEFKKNKLIDKLSGTENLRVMINQGKSYDEIIQSYSAALEDFKTKRSKILLYE